MWSFFSSSFMVRRAAASVAALAAALLFALPAPAAAQLSRIGDRVLANVQVRGTDTAYDPGAGQYLQVGANGNVFGICMDRNGVPTTSMFTIISPGHYGVFARAEYSPDVVNGTSTKGGFLVTWDQDSPSSNPNINEIHSVLVSCAGPDRIVSSEQVLSDYLVIGSWFEAGAAVAYSITSQRFLVVWQTLGGGVQGRLVSSTGVPIGGLLVYENALCKDPGVAWNSATDEFGVSYVFFPQNVNLRFLTIRPSDGVRQTRTTFDNFLGAFNTDVTVDPFSHHYIMGWYSYGGSIGSGTSTAEFDAAGNWLDERLISSQMGGNDNFSLDFSGSGTILAVGQSNQAWEVGGAELNAHGVNTSGTVILTSLGNAPIGPYYPRVAGRQDAGEWNVSFSWEYNKFTQQAIATSNLVGTAASMTSPASGSALTASSQLFQWDAGTNATQYFIWAGTTGVGSSNIALMDRGTTQSATITGLPTDASTIYVRLVSVVGGSPLSKDYTYTAENLARLTSPTNGAAFATQSVTFNWSAATGATQYFLWVGSSVGANDLASQDRGTNLSAVVAGLPADGRTLFVRLWSLMGTWQSNDYTYTAATAAAMTSPANGATLTSASQTFTWGAASGATQYYVWLGSTGAGSNNLGVFDRGTNLNATLGGLPTNGSTIYVRLWSLVNGVWLSRDYTYTALAGPAQITSPANGSALTNSTITFTWSGAAGATQYYLWVGSSAGANDLAIQDRGTNLNGTVSGLPVDGRTLFVRLWSLIGTWQSNDYTYTAANAAPITSPTQGSTLPGASVTFTWTAGTNVTQYYLWVGTTGVGSSNLDNLNRGTNLSGNVTNLPSSGGGTIYVRLWSLINGTTWLSRDYTYSAAGLVETPAPAPDRR
jgi:hypothetical protein